MKTTFRTILGVGLAFGALASPALAQGNSDKANKGQTKVEKSAVKTNQKAKKTYSKTGRRTTRNVTYRTRVLCEDGVVVYRSTGCAGHGGLASRQGTYGSSYPPASDRARERASENSAVIRGRGANNVRTDAIARCNDGTYWHASDRINACYLHGGVAVWY